MTLVYLIPTKPIDNNVRKSAPIFKEEGVSPVLVDGITGQCDNYTDALILLEAAHKNDNNALVSAMEVKEGRIRDQFPSKTVVDYYMNHKQFTRHRPYPRYWHGNLLLIKPLMSFINYYGFRIINSIIVLITMILVIWFLFKKNEKEFIAPYIISMLFLMPLTVAFNIQLSSCFYVLNFGLIALLATKNKSPNKSIYIFLYLGIATAFFDLLTYPIATFGVPCTLYLFMCGRKPLKCYFIKMLKAGSLWGVGYLVMWFAKWLIATRITDRNVLEDAYNKVNTRIYAGTTAANKLTNIIETEKTNIKYFLKTPAVFIALIYILIMIVLIIKQHKRIKDNIILVVPFVVLMLVPCVWYAIATQHSQEHAWFTYKALVVSAISGLTILAYLYKCNKKKERNAA